MHARFVKLQWENPARTLGTVYLHADKPYYFTAGQYADITIPHNDPDMRGLTRTMTFSSNPSEKHLGFTTRFSTTGSSYKEALLRLKPGDAVNLTDAMGDMVLPLDESIPLVLVAGGVGVASFVSMIRWLTEHRDKRNITLLYAVRDIGDVLYQSDFARYASIGDLTSVLYTTDVKREGLQWLGSIKKSRITAADIHAHMKPEAQVYISGTEPMVEQLRRQLEKDFGVAHYKIAFDYFEGYSGDI